jgi:hypothetical protein
MRKSEFGDGLSDENRVGEQCLYMPVIPQHFA